jgi:hypothetical protein
MNMVALLGLGSVLNYNIIQPLSGGRTIGLIVVLVAAIAVVWSVWQSKREGGDIMQLEAEETSADTKK